MWPQQQSHSMCGMVTSRHFSIGKEYFSRPSEYPRQKLVLSLLDLLLMTLKDRNLFPRHGIIEGVVNSLHKRVASGATPAKGAAPAEVIRVQRIHHNSSKLLMNSQFHLRKYSNTSSVAKQWTCSRRTPQLVMWCSGNWTTSKKSYSNVIYWWYIWQT